MGRIVSVLITLFLLSCGKSSGEGALATQGPKTEPLKTSRCKLKEGTLKEVALSGYHSLDYCSDDEFAAEVSDDNLFLSSGDKGKISKELSSPWEKLY